MSDKDISNQIKKGTIFDEFIPQLDIHEVNRRYVERVVVFYENGTKAILEVGELPETILASNYNKWLMYKYKIFPIADVKIFIDTAQLGIDVNENLKGYWDCFT